MLNMVLYCFNTVKSKKGTMGIIVWPSLKNACSTPRLLFLGCVGRQEKKLFLHIFFFFSLLHNGKNHDFLMKMEQIFFSKSATRSFG